MKISDLSVTPARLRDGDVACCCSSSACCAVTRLSLREFPDVERPVVTDRDALTAARPSDVVETKHHADHRERDRRASKASRSSLRRASTSARSINVEFDRWIATWTSAANDVRDRVSRVIGDLPEEADPPEISKVGQRRRPVICLTLSSRHAERARAHRLRRALPRRPARRAAGRGPRAHERRAPLRHAHLARSREALAARQLTVADVEARAAPRERRAAGRPARVAAARVHAAHRRPACDTEEDFRKLVSGAARTAIWCAWAKWPTCGSRRRTNAACRATNGVPGISHRHRHAVQGQHARRRARVQARSSRESSTTCPRARASSVNIDSAVFIDASMNEVVDRAGDRDGARARRDLPVPRQPARDADPRDHHPGLDRRRVHRDGRARVSRSTC